MYEYQVREVIKVIDADTLDLIIDIGFGILYKIRVRLDGLNSYESRTKNKKEKLLGEKAKDFTYMFLHKEIAGLYYDGMKKIIVNTTHMDKYGRWLAHVWVNGKSLAKALTKAGLARSYHGEKRGEWKAKG